jgi:hypothetical protein
VSPRSSLTGFRSPSVALDDQREGRGLAPTATSELPRIRRNVQTERSRE